MKKIDFIVGARPNFIKAFPVYDAFKKQNAFNLRLINTGQHYDKNMSDIFFRQLEMKNPDINFMVGSGSHAEQTAAILLKAEQVFLENSSDLVVVFGDVNSTIAAAIAAAKLNIPVAHIESGLRSFDKRMPEEINRIITDQISELLFITSLDAKENLIREGKNEDQIFFVGNTMIDSLVRFNDFFNADAILDNHKLEVNEFILVTMHRPSNVDNKDKFTDFLNALNLISEKYPIIWPAHPRIRKSINQNLTTISSSVYITEPFGYFEFMGLQKNAKIIITDSGGVQEESTYFRVPCLTVRENTERPITITDGTNKLIGTDFSKLLTIIEKNEYSDKNKIPQLWDGKSSERILKCINNYYSIGKYDKK